MSSARKKRRVRIGKLDTAEKILNADNTEFIPGLRAPVLPFEDFIDISRDGTRGIDDSLQADDDDAILPAHTFDGDPNPTGLLKIWKNRSSLTAVMLTRGSTSYTRDGYERLRALVKPYVGIIPDLAVPDFTTLNRSQFAFVLERQRTM